MKFFNRKNFINWKVLGFFFTKKPLGPDPDLQHFVTIGSFEDSSQKFLTTSAQGKALHNDESVL